MTAIIILGWLYVCAMSFSIMMILDNCSKEELKWCVPWFILGPLWIVIGWLIIKPIRELKEKREWEKKFKKS